MIFRKLAGTARNFAMLATSAAQAQNFNGASFEINRDRVKLGTIKTCAKNEVYLIPTTYLYVSIRNRLSAGGGLGFAKAKARVYIDGLRKSELQGLAAGIQNEIVGQLRAASYKVLTYDDVKSDVADKERMAPNPRYGIATHDSRAFPGIDFAVATPTDERTLDYGLMGPQANFGKAAQRTGATLLLPEVYITLPQLGAQANKTQTQTQTQTWRSSNASISFDPAMHFAGANVYGATAKGGWCSINVPRAWPARARAHCGHVQGAFGQQGDVGRRLVDHERRLQLRRRQRGVRHRRHDGEQDAGAAGRGLDERGEVTDSLRRRQRQRRRSRLS